jgi:hypothetical protein
MGRPRVASWGEPFTLLDCAAIAEDVEADLDRVAAVLDELTDRDGRRDPCLEFVSGALVDLARKLEAAKDALYTHAREAVA